MRDLLNGWKRFSGLGVGIVLAGLQALLVYHGTKSYIENEARGLAENAVQRAINQAEWRLDQVLLGISELSTLSIGSCSEVDIGELRRLVIGITPIKELSIVGADGLARCPHLGLGGRARPVSIERPIAVDDNVLLSVVRMIDRDQRALRVRWRRLDEPLSLSALIPADMLISGIETSINATETGLSLLLTDGTLIVGNDTPDMLLEGRVYLRKASVRFPIEGLASSSLSAVFAAHKDLVVMAAVGSAIIGVMIIAFAASAPWRKRNDPMAAIERGLAAGEFQPYFQPILDLTTGRLAGAEVLVRWHKPDGTVVSPGYFVPLMESGGLANELARVVMRQARDQVGAVLGRHPNVRVSFNVDSAHFVDGRIVKDVAQIFQNSPLRLSQVVVEITERQPLKSLTAARNVIAALQQIGCRVAIDDVGAGHSGLSYILKLGVDIIKIDKIFVDSIGSERHSTVIIDTLVDLCRNMQISIVAEGVETFDQVQVLREHGVKLAQGHVFAPALPAKSFVALLEATQPGKTEPAAESKLEAEPSGQEAEQRLAS